MKSTLQLSSLEFEVSLNRRVALKEHTIFDLEPKNGEENWLTKNNNEKLNELSPIIKNQWWIRLLLTLRDIQKVEFEDWFIAIDLDKSNTIEVEEMMKAEWGPKNKKLRFDQETCQRLASIFDPYNKEEGNVKRIQKIEFLALKQFVKRAMKVFGIYDENFKGHLNREKFPLAIQTLFGFSISYSQYKMLKEKYGKGLFTNYIELPEFIKISAYIGQIMTIYQEMEYVRTKQYRLVVLEGTVQQRTEYRKLLDRFIGRVLTLKVNE